MPTILLADDSITIQKIVNLTFSGEGIDVVTVGNGEAAVKKIHELHPSLVLADIFMPGKNGYEVCDYIKNEPSLSATPVILLVGAFEPFDSSEAARVKADGHLTKPFEIKVLISAVNSLLSSEPREISDSVPEVAVSVAVSDVSLPQVSVPEVADPRPPAEAPSVGPFAPLPEMPASVRSLNIESPVELSSQEPEEMAAPIALGVDSEEVERLEASVPEPIAEVPSLADSYVSTRVEPAPSAPEPVVPSLTIEESDPLGLLAADGGFGAARYGELASDARSMVVDIWEPRAPIEAPGPSVIEESGTIALVEGAEEAPSEIPIPEPAMPELEAAPALIPESTMEEARVEFPTSQPAMAVVGPSTETRPELAGASAPISEELIDRIANRVIEKLSRDVIERIAWEVVPDLAELMIKEHVDAQLKESHRS